MYLKILADWFILAFWPADRLNHSYPPHTLLSVNEGYIFSLKLG